VSVRQTVDEYVAIIPIHEYLKSLDGDAASTFFARLSPRPITQLSALADAVFSTTELETFLDLHLSPDLIRRWIDRQSDVAAVRGELRLETQPQLLIDGLLAAARDAPGELSKAIDRFESELPFRALLLALTDSRLGRVAAAGVLKDRLGDRIADTRSKLADYDALIHTPSTTETAVQRFLEGNPWIVGLPYVAARARVQIPRGVLDFVLDRFDGFFDVVELKGPHDPIITEANQSLRRCPDGHPSEMSLQPTLYRKPSAKDRLGRDSIVRRQLCKPMDATSRISFCDLTKVHLVAPSSDSLV
jgi:hypothetical protein